MCTKGEHPVKIKAKMEVRLLEAKEQAKDYEQTIRS